MWGFALGKTPEAKLQRDFAAGCFTLFGVCGKMALYGRVTRRFSV
jgi:hypothetical protein